MYKYKWYIDTGFGNEKYDGVWEFDEEPAKQELDDMWEEELRNRCEGWYELLEDDE